MSFALPTDEILVLDIVSSLDSVIAVGMAQYAIAGAPSLAAS